MSGARQRHGSQADVAGATEGGSHKMTKGSTTSPMRPRQYSATRAELRRGDHADGGKRGTA